MTTEDMVACSSAKASTGARCSEFPHVEIDLEDQIDRQAQLMRTSSTPGEQRAAWERLKTLHAMRSPERIEAMERERGLR